MKFSLIYEAQTADTSRAGDARVLNEIVEQAILAEEVGFDVIWAVEHTALEQYAHMSVPETVLAFIAGRTSRIHVGHGVICLPPNMNHPVKVAERCAALDILSNGRLQVGFGKGGTQQESGTFGYDLEKLPPMIDEAMRLVPRIWMEDLVEHHGEFIDIPPRPIHPKPLQDPHPPLYMACTRDSTLNDAGARGIGALVLGFGGPEQVAKKNAIYREAYKKRNPAEQVGYRPTEHLAALCPAIVLEDGQEARRIGLRGQRFFMESIAYWNTNGETPMPEPDTWPDDLTVDAGDGTSVIKSAIGAERISVDFSDPSMALLNPNHAYGTVDDCIGYVNRLIEAGADEILFLNQMGTVPQWAMMETIRNIGKHVIPKFR
ncbi:MAG: LLM class flavin-dependent oxidoreductase [Spirochaetaceae bacterium]|nr:LLM class flavin-dependent oxidoreductase [Myxococcales bacterium]MCB9725539.1 LLM class flavin-dependent oxidoreductase [Spirochaetaceae bacterium]